MREGCIRACCIPLKARSRNEQAAKASTTTCNEPKATQCARGNSSSETRNSHPATSRWKARDKGDDRVATDADAGEESVRFLRKSWPVWAIWGGAALFIAEIGRASCR